MTHWKYFSGLAIILAAFLHSCNPARHLADKQYLLLKNVVAVENPQKNAESSDLSPLILQKPNRKILGVAQFRLSMYYTFKKGWLHREIGEPPAIMDPSQTEASRIQIVKYLENIGYFNSSVETEVLGNRPKKRKVRYNVRLNEPYRVRDIQYKIQDETLLGLVLHDTANSLIKNGNIYNAYVFDNERDRITSYLQDIGYYGFLKDNIFYRIDSSFRARKLDVYLNIENNAGAGMEKGKFEQYHVNNIYVYPNFKPFVSDTTVFDTLDFLVDPFRRETAQLYRYIYAPPLKINPRIISQSLFIESDKRYNLSRVKRTLRRLNDLSIYKFADVVFKEPDTAVTFSPEQNNQLDCHVYLTRAPVHSYSVELQGTNTGGDLGLAAYLVYQNRNIFRGAETFRVRLKGALEAQKYTTVVDDSQLENLPFFNTIETGIEANLFFPKFLLPVRQERFSKSFEPKTSINTGYNYQSRPDYKRFLSNLSFGYEWTESKFRQHMFFPADISLIKVSNTPAFDSLLNITNDEQLKSQYTDHLITSMRYTYTYNNQEINRIKNFIYFRGTFETSGNLVNTLQKLGGIAKNEDGYRTLLYIRYAQYIKPNLEFRYYYFINRVNSLVFRAFTGIAKTYGNSIAMPFEKGYFAGGANGMRGWQLRSLGPGSYSPGSIRVERVGDLQIEGNIEYRFPVYSFLASALFLDVGNIWLLNDNSTFPGGKFNIDSFWKEIAMDGGLGIRFDFNFFIIRMDIAHKLHDPSLPQGDRWVFDNLMWRTLVWNLGIGYPF
ncbi:MAG: BamA/TamA family outer membrane protein [Bacteroidales bacterium]|nr:BamA/TamA family outer membrane protein [Bacteroidales bacterium]